MISKNVERELGGSVYVTLCGGTYHTGDNMEQRASGNHARSTSFLQTVYSETENKKKMTNIDFALRW